MSIHNLDGIFHPKSVAVIGANERKDGVGSAIMRNLMEGGFKGGIHPINPAYRSVWGFPFAASVLDLDTPPDLAVIATPIDAVPKIVGQCARKGVKGAVVISAGGKETGEKGRAVEDAIRRAAAGSGLRIVGPNCIGVISHESRLNASFAPRMPMPGKTAFISHSGSIYMSFLDLSIREKMGFSYFVSLGSMLDVDLGDMIDYLGGDYRVGSIILYIEHLTRFRNFMSAARAVSRVKPIIAFKAGRTPVGGKAAASHTGGTAGEDAVYDAAFRRAGILRVRTFEELFDCAELLDKAHRPTGGRLGIITNAGGPGVMAVDALSDYGMAPAPLSPETRRLLNGALPPYWSRSNPIDILANAAPERYREAVRICIGAEEFDALLIMLAPHALSRPTETAAVLRDLLNAKPFPVFTAWIGGPGVEEGRNIFNDASIPTFDTPERAVRAFMNLHHHDRAVKTLREIPPKLPDLVDIDRDAAQRIIEENLSQTPTPLSETDAGTLTAAYGIPVHSSPQATPAEDPKKDDAIELVMGARRDPLWGPTLFFGMGGVLTDIIQDLALALPPLNRLLARRLIKETRIYAHLKGEDADEGDCLSGLEETLIRLSQLVVDFPQIAELEINPLRVGGGRIRAADVRVVLAPAPSIAPHHLVISPYPNQYEEEAVLKDGQRLLVRPIRPEDAPLFEEMFKALSPKSVYFRFFSAIRTLRHEVLARFTQIDYDREMALVAIREAGGEEEMLGVARIIVEQNGLDAEFAVLIRDDWQGKGVGAELLGRCLDIARERRLRKVWGLVLQENRNMLALGKKLGFIIKRDPDSSDYLLSLVLDPPFEDDQKRSE